MSHNPFRVGVHAVCKQIWPRVMQTVTNRSFLLIPMFKAQKGGCKTISITGELFFSNFGDDFFEEDLFTGFTLDHYSLT